MRTGHAQRGRQPARAAGQLTSAFVSATFLHGAQSSARFDRSKENKTFLISFGQHIEHPVHSVVEVNVSRTGPVRGDKFPGRRAREGVACGIAGRGVGFALHDNPAASAPDQLASHQGARTFDRGLREELPRDHSGTGWSMNFHGTRNFFANCAASACTPSVSVA